MEYFTFLNSDCIPEIGHTSLNFLNASVQLYNYIQFWISHKIPYILKLDSGRPWLSVWHMNYLYFITRDCGWYLYHIGLIIIPLHVGNEISSASMKPSEGTDGPPGSSLRKTYCSYDCLTVHKYPCNECIALKDLLWRMYGRNVFLWLSRYINFQWHMFRKLCITFLLRKTI